MLVVLFDLAAHVQQEGAIGGVDHLRTAHAFDRRDDLRPVLAIGSIDDDVAQALRPIDLDQVDRADHSACLADRPRERPQRAMDVVDLHANREAVLRARRGAHRSGCSFMGGRAC